MFPWTSWACRDNSTTINTVKEDLCIWIQLVFISWLIDDDFPWRHCPACLFLFPRTGVVSVAFDFPSSSLCLDSYESTSHIFFMKDISMSVLQESDVLIPSTKCSLLGNGPWEQEKRAETSSFLWPSLCLKSHFDFEDLSVFIPKERDLDQPISKFLRALTI